MDSIRITVVLSFATPALALSQQLRHMESVPLQDDQHPAHHYVPYCNKPPGSTPELAPDGPHEERSCNRVIRHRGGVCPKGLVNETRAWGKTSTRGERAPNVEMKTETMALKHECQVEKCGLQAMLVMVSRWAFMLPFGLGLGLGLGRACHLIASELRPTHVNNRLQCKNHGVLLVSEGDLYGLVMGHLALEEQWLTYLGHNPPSSANWDSSGACFLFSQCTSQLSELGLGTSIGMACRALVGCWLEVNCGRADVCSQVPDGAGRCYPAVPYRCHQL